MVNTHQTADFLIIGGGVIGLSIARELKRRYCDCRIIVLEKEAEIGAHASGRNSGVLHAGFYYTKDSLKAKFTKNGNQMMSAYCREKGIQMNTCGKLVVARNAEELQGLYELKKRGDHNGIELDLISEQEAREIEPRVKTFDKAIFSKTTSSVSPQVVMEHLLADARAEGIEVRLGVRYLKNSGNQIKTNAGEFSAGYVINAGGLYADKIGKNFGFSQDYTILPFKGLYLYGTSTGEKLRTHIYPVPDLRNPFLGVHFTLTADGHIKIGPTAIPAFWREHYQGLSRFSLAEVSQIVSRECSLFFKAGFDFRRLAFEEMRKYSRHVLTKLAGELLHGVHKDNYKTWCRPGIRAQLLNVKTRKLEMDFLLEGDNRSMHVLNAVSPAFTCSMPFAVHVVDQIGK